MSSYELCIYIKILTSEMSIRVRRIWAIGWSNWENRLSHSAINRPWPTAARAYWSCDLHQHPLLSFFSDQIPFLTCFWCNPFPLSLRSILLNPTPIAPEDTRTTRCPCARSFTTVSTIDERSRRCGTKGYVGDTIEEVPESKFISRQPIRMYLWTYRVW